MPSSASSDTPSAGSPGTPSPGAPGVPETAENATPPDDIDVTVENAAEILAAEDDSPPPTARTSRRRLLIGGGIAAAAIVAGGAWLTVRRTDHGIGGTAEELPLVIGGDICAAPLYAAYHQGYFDDAGLKVTLARTQRTEDTKDAVSAGKYIGAPGIFFSWL